MAERPQEADAFTFFAKFGEACAALSEDQRKEVFYALCMYGTYGAEVEVADPMARAFVIMARDDIDNSKRMRELGEKSGRSRRRRAQAAPVAGQAGEAREGGESPVREDGAQGCAKGANGVQESHANPVHESCAQNGGKDANQYSPVQTKPNQTKGVKGARFAPPTPQQVEEYARSRGGGVDGRRFCDFYASKGWRVGSSPMRDWRAAVRNWQSRDGGGATGAQRADFSAYASTSQAFEALG